jgi:hypothetical protein
LFFFNVKFDGIWRKNRLFVQTLIRVVVTASIEENNLKWLPIVLSIVGICLCLSVWGFARQFNDIMRQKYERCKAIEKKFGMEQHTKLKYSSGVQKMIYSFIMSIFIALWVIIILYTKCGLLKNIIYFLFFIPLEAWR